MAQTERTDKIVIAPQKGFQEQALSTPADIAILGASAGVGKTYVLLLEPLRHVSNPGFGGVIFRRTSPQIRNEGGLWDTSARIYPLLGAEPIQSSLEWRFKKGPKLKFSHIEYDKNVLDWQGSQIPFIGFDELTHFSEYMFFYLLSRNRSTCGVNPYVRATCNPDPDSWVFKLVEWWIGDDGFPIKERNGVLRYFIKHDGKYIWGDSKAEVIEAAWYMLEPQIQASGLNPENYVKSITFISGSIYDNKELLKSDPGYLANLNALDAQEKSILLDGNWKVVISENEIYDYAAFIGMFDDVYKVDHGTKYITADIAMEGSDKFIVGAWDGNELIDISIIDKNNGKEVVDVLTSFSNKYRVPNRNMVYDADGVGSFVGGFFPGAQPFNNGGAVISKPGEPKENYENLKTQCFYKSAKKVKDGLIRVSEHVANKMYDEKTTVRQRLIQERKAIKKAGIDMDGKLKIIPKKQMKLYLDGQSPDCFIAGTKVLTIKGWRNIEDIKVGEYVITPYRITKVVAAIKKTAAKTFTLNEKLTGTGNHKIFTINNPKRLDELMINDYIYSSSIINLIVWRFQSLLNTKARNIGFRAMRDIIMPTTNETKSDIKSLYTDKYGWIQQAKTFLTAFMSIILMEIPIIIILKTWSALKDTNTYQRMFRSDCQRLKEWVLRGEEWIMQDRQRTNGMDLMLENSGIAEWQKMFGKTEQQFQKNAMSVGQSFKHIDQIQPIFVQTNAGNETEQKRRKIILDNLILPSVVKSLSANIENVDVFTLTLEKDNCYFANGVLVENCMDMFMMRSYFDLVPERKIIAF